MTCTLRGRRNTGKPENICPFDRLRVAKQQAARLREKQIPLFPPFVKGDEGGFFDLFSETKAGRITFRPLCC
jgi:hypothetical protein